MKHRILLWVVIVVASAAGVAACGSGGSGSDASAPVGPGTPGVGIGLLGVVEDRSSGLVGGDANANGVRDDVDALIDLKYASAPSLQRASLQQARAVQAFLLATDKASATAAAGLVLKAVACLAEVLPDGAGDTNRTLRRRAALEIEALTANTRERVRQYARVSDFLHGSTFDAPASPVCVA